MKNGALFQFFHWYTPDEGKFWNHGAEQAAALAELGVSAVWLPPAYKSMSGIHSNGYDSYDLFDMGEFDQKGTIRARRCLHTFYFSGKKAYALGIYLGPPIFYRSRLCT